MNDELATLDDLKDRCEWTLDPDEERVAQATLVDLSEDARFYGSTAWNSVLCPRQVKSLVLRATVRYLRNPDGFLQSRAGDEAVHWTDRGEDAGTATFTKKEQEMLATIAGRTRGLMTAPIQHWGTPRQRGPRLIDPMKPGVGTPADVLYVEGAGGPFPFYADSTSQWV